MKKPQLILLCLTMLCLSYGGTFRADSFLPAAPSPQLFPCAIKAQYFFLALSTTRRSNTSAILSRGQVKTRITQKGKRL